MKSTKVQLLITLAAVLASAGAFLAKGPPPETGLWGAAWDGSTLQARRALDWGVSTYIRVPDTGWTPLQFAASRGYTEIVALLIEHGADVNARDDGGFTALHAAAFPLEGDTRELTELILECGADIDARTSDGKTALHLTAMDGWTEMAELLILKKADVNAKDSGGYTPLALAAVFGHKEIAELLVQSGADLSARVNGGDTPLALAYRYGHGVVADLLRCHGATE